jgi:uncharacterized glyoxalase superfamily protein PhnB
MNLTLSHCFITVRDQEEALAFYRDVVGLEVRSDDCDGLFEKAVAAGADVVQEPKDQPYGVRDCAVRDPSKNMVRFSQPLSARPR